MKISIYWLFVNFRFPDFQSFKFLMKTFLQVCRSVKPKVFVKHSPGPGGEPRVFESQSDVLLKDHFAVFLSGVNSQLLLKIKLWTYLKKVQACRQNETLR